jgi:hypothetical protein
VLTKVAAGQVTLFPTYTAAFFTYMGLLEGSSAEQIQQRFSTAFIPTMVRAVAPGAGAAAVHAALERAREAEPLPLPLYRFWGACSGLPSTALISGSSPARTECCT